MSSSRYPLHIAVLACLVTSGYGRQTSIFPKTTSVIENTTLRLDCIYKDSITVTPQSCRWTANSLSIAIIDTSCSIGNFYPDIYSFECTNTTFNTVYIFSTGRRFHNTTFSCSFFVVDASITGYSTVHVVVPVSQVKMTEPGIDIVTTTENTPVIFICNTSSAHPRPNITWLNDSQTQEDYKDDVEITNTVTEFSYSDGYLYAVTSNLTFYTTKYDNGSSIYCNASNTGRQSISSTRMALLYVQYSPSSPTFYTRSNVRLKDVFVIVNNTLMIRCKSSGNPMPRYIWTTSQNKEVFGEDINIENIKRTDDGTFSCMAYNSFTTVGEKRNHNTSASIKVSVLFPPDSPDFYFIKSGRATQVVNSTLKIVKGDDVSIFCNSTGNPHPVSVWNGAESSDTLSLKSIEADVSNTCTSSSVMKETSGETRNISESKELKIIVLHPPGTPIIKIHLSGDIKDAYDIMSIVENTNIVLECSAESKPNSTFTWTRSMANTIKDLSKQMILNHIQRHQSGTYTCHARNVMVPSFGDTEIGRNNRSVYFDVLYPPDTPTFYYLENGNKQKINTLPLNVVEGDNVSVLCNATGNPTTTSVWMDNDTKTDTLSIVAVESQHLTNFTCKSSNVMHVTFRKSRNGTSSKTLPVIVLYPPRSLVIQIEMKLDSRKEEALNSTGILEGSDFTLYCDTVSNPPPSYKWTGPVTSNYMTNTAALFVRNIQRNQSGSYICDAQNKMERTFGIIETGRNNQSIYIDILYKAAIKYFGAADFKNNKNMITVNQGEETQIICRVESKPFANSTIYFKARLVNETIRSDTVFYNLINTSCSDAGRYICKGKNEYNYITEASKELFLYVKCLPQPSSDHPPEKNVSAALLGSAVFRFHAALYYDPGTTQFRWFKQEHESRSLLQNGTKAYILSSGIHSVLHINDLSEADYGMYILEYSNSVGMNHFTFYLQQKDQTKEMQQSNDKNYLPMAIGIVTAVLVIVGVTLGIVIYIRRYKRKTDNGSRSYDNICVMNAKSGENTSINSPVYEGLKPNHERGYVEMKEQAYDILTPKDSVETNDPVYTNLKL